MDSNFRALMGKRIKDKRKELSLTQEQMAEYLNITPKHYGKFERGEAGMSLELIIAVSDLLDLSLDYLIKGILPCKPTLSDRINQVIVECPLDRQEKLLEIMEIAAKL